MLKDGPLCVSSARSLRCDLLNLMRKPGTALHLEASQFSSGLASLFRKCNPCDKLNAMFPLEVVAPPDQNELLALLLGPLGLLVASLLLNVLQARGYILSRKVVHKDDYDCLLEINVKYAEAFGQQTAAIVQLAKKRATR